jgi:hypothetical protein
VVQSDAAASVVEKVVSVGSIDLILNREVKLAPCSVYLLIVGDGRPNVLQIKSYTSFANAKTPSLLFQGTTSASTFEGLNGQNIAGEVYVAMDANNDIWQSTTIGSSIISVSSVTESELIGNWLPSPVMSPEGKTSIVNGSFQAVMVKP